MHDQEKLGFVAQVTQMDGDLTPGAALAALQGFGPLVLLESAGGRPARFSLLGIKPRVCLELRGQPELVWTQFEQALECLGAAQGEPIPGPFHGGFLGALAYDLLAPGARLEMPAELGSEPFDQPLVAGGIYTDFLVWDHVQKRCDLVVHQDGQVQVDAVLGALGKSVAGELHEPGVLHRETSAELHMQGVEAVRREIRAGEIYQANLSHRLHGHVPGPAVDAYNRMIASNPVPYAAFINWSDGALLSASPELLFECDPRDTPGRQARTRPIKGTAPRSTDPVQDAALGAALVASVKDRAELAMIVDLERNDLGRVASCVRVDAMARLELYTSVQHLVSDVSADLLPGTTSMDLFTALFPGGSITGAPKLRSMEVIASIEGSRRGFFTGSAGFVDTRGAACFNILIRSLLWKAGEVSLRVGGGVTWASDARAEDEETLHKAASLLAGLGARLVT